MTDVESHRGHGPTMIWQIQLVRGPGRPTRWRLTVNNIVQGEYATWHLAEKERRRKLALH